MKHEQTVAVLVAARTLEQAAEALNITPLTLRRWLHEDAELQQLYQLARREVMQHSLGRLQRITSSAVSRLEDLLNDPTVSAASSVSAAKAVIEIALRAVTLEDLDARITTIEHELRKRKGAET